MSTYSTTWAFGRANVPIKPENNKSDFRFFPETASFASAFGALSGRMDALPLFPPPAEFLFLCADYPALAKFLVVRYFSVRELAPRLDYDGDSHPRHGYGKQYSGYQEDFHSGCRGSDALVLRDYGVFSDGQDGRNLHQLECGALLQLENSLHQFARYSV